MSVSYEWAIEHTDIFGDIQDIDFSDELSWFKHSDLGPGLALVLVRNEGNDEDGLTGRTWAYVNDGQLHPEFEDGHQVPKRFHVELQRWILKAK